MKCVLCNCKITEYNRIYLIGCYVCIQCNSAYKELVTLNDSESNILTQRGRDKIQRYKEDLKRKADKKSAKRIKEALSHAENKW